MWFNPAQVLMEMENPRSDGNAYEKLVGQIQFSKLKIGDIKILPYDPKKHFFYSDAVEEFGKSIGYELWEGSGGFLTKKVEQVKPTK